MIEGNITAVLQTKGTSKNAIGESVETWVDVQEITGWLDYMGGSSEFKNFNTKTQESTHLFICDYVEIPAITTIGGITYSISAETCRMAVNSQVYDVLLIDDPMQMHSMLEIYLKFTGGQ